MITVMITMHKRNDYQDTRNISHGDNYHDKLQYVRRTVGQRCYGHIDFITRAEIKSYDFSI